MIVEKIFHWARVTPHATAVIYNGQRQSYRAFARQIARARSFFTRRGFTGPGHAVLAVRHLGEFWSLSLALRSLGFTSVAARSPAALQQLTLPDLRLVATLAQESWPGLDAVCAARELPLLSVTLDSETSLPLEVACPPCGGHIVWTSGTTGADKMLLLSADGDAYFLPRRVEIAGMDQGTTLCLFNISGSSAAGYRWTPSPWIAGGATLFEQAPDRHQALRRPGITHAMANPAILSHLLARPADAFPRSETLKLFVTGGAMTRTQVDQIKARITPQIFNVLASSESGPVAVTRLDGDDDRRWHRLLPDHRVELVDEAGYPVPPGEVGEMRVGTLAGPTFYVEDEAATRAFFRDGFFYPGDLAMMREDGRLGLMGRVIDVINMQGKKISPAPFEDRLADSLGAGVCLFSACNDDGEEELHVAIEAPGPPERFQEKCEALPDAAARQLHPEPRQNKVPDGLSDVLRELWGFKQATVHLVRDMPRNEMGKIVRREVRALAEKSPGLKIQW
jgi:acyl-coenzyme A synthetase/AMP-(fatty) acid ligase